MFRAELGGLRDELKNDYRGQMVVLRDGLREEMTTLRNELKNDFRGQMNGLRGDIVTLKADITKVQTKVEEEIRNVKKLVKTEIQSVRNDVKALQTELQNTEKRLAQQIADNHMITVKVCNCNYPRVLYAHR